MMTDKAFLDDTTVSIPLKSYEEETSKDDDLPPPYEHPKIDISSGWKDRWFAIAFWLHALTVIIVGLVLGIPYLNSIRTGISAGTKFRDKERSLVNKYLGSLVYALGGAAAAGGLTSLVTFFLLQLCAGRIIICTLIISVVIEVLLGVVLLLTVHWSACIPPFVLLIITLIFTGCVWKRIPFAEVHLRVGCAALHSNPSIILVALAIFIVEFLWFIAWSLMVLGIMHAIDGRSAVNVTEDAATPAYVYSTTAYNTADTQSTGNNVLRNVIGFVLLLSWYWGAVIFGNIVHFISACTLARWWFGNNDEEQYSLGRSTRRAFTTNFGTISFGSLIEALLKAARSSTEKRGRANILACVASCVLKILEKIVGYMNEWAFIYAALTGQSFVQASRSFIELFKKRGWTMVINDTIIGQALAMINLMVALTSSVVGGVLVYIFVKGLLEEGAIIAIVIAACLGFLLGFLFSSILTTILSSCVRTTFVCFALNPAALGATHPEHLQRLIQAWHKFYPTEFAASGYPDHLMKFNRAENV